MRSCRPRGRATTAQYRANVLAFLQAAGRSAARARSCFYPAIPRTPTTRPRTTGGDRPLEAADLVPGDLLLRPGGRPLEAGSCAGASRRLRATMRSRLGENLIGDRRGRQNRLGMMLTFSSTPKAGGREGLAPLSKWLDGRQVGGARSEAGLDRAATSRASGRGAGRPSTRSGEATPTSRRPPARGSGHVTTALCDAPVARRPGELDPSLEVGLDAARRDALPARPDTVAGGRRRRPAPPDRRPRSRLLRRASARGARGGDRPSAPGAVADAVRGVILEQLRRQPGCLSGGSRGGARAAPRRSRARSSPTSCAGEASRPGSTSTGPSLSQLREWYDTYSSTNARSVGRGQTGALARRHCAPALRSAARHPAVCLGARRRSEHDKDRRREADRCRGGLRRSARSRSRRPPRPCAAAFIAQQKDAAFAIWAAPPPESSSRQPHMPARPAAAAGDRRPDRLVALPRVSARRPRRSCGPCRAPWRGGAPSPPAGRGRCPGPPWWELGNAGREEERLTAPIGRTEIAAREPVGELFGVVRFPTRARRSRTRRPRRGTGCRRCGSRARAARRPRQEGVAGEMADPVVHRLEVVEVEDDQGQTRA